MICIHTMVRERRLLQRCNGSEKDWQKHRVSWHCRQDPPTRILRLHFCNGSATMKRRTFIKDASVLGLFWVFSQVFLLQSPAACPPGETRPPRGILFARRRRAAFQSHSWCRMG